MNNFLNLLPPQFCYWLFGLKLPFYFNFFILGLILYRPIEFLLKNKYLRLILIFAPSLFVLFHLLRNNFFFQSDDFAHLKISAEWSFWDIFSKGMGKEAIWGFHHIFIGFWLFKMIFILFGTKFESYLFFNFLLHLVNLFLLYLIVNKIKKSPVFSVLATFLFGTFYLSWISNIHELIAATFFLLGVFSWLNWLFLMRKRYLYSTLLFYLLAVLSKEITSLFPLIMIFLSICFDSYVSKLNFKKVLRALIPFFVLFGFHFWLYGKVYFRFLNLGEGDGYSVQFLPTVFLKNFLVYLTKIIPILNSSVLGFLIFLLIVGGFDLWKKRLLLTPLFFSFVILLAPAALFQKNAFYYVYIPSIFLYILFFIFFREIYLLLSGFFKKRRFVFGIFNIYFVLIIVLGIFKVDKFFMDNCFLICYPWPNPHRIALNSLTQKLDKMFQEDKIKDGVEIKLDEKEITHEMKYLFTTNVLYLFLKDPKAIDYTFVFDEDRSVLLVEKISSYHKISF